VQSCVISEVLRRISTVRRVDDYDLSGIGFLVSFFGLYLRDFATHSDGVSPAGVWRCIYLYILDCFVLYYYYCFVYSGIYFIFMSLSLSYARLVVRTWRDKAPLIRSIISGV
jgi:hypothetical protein